MLTLDGIQVKQGSFDLRVSLTVERGQRWVLLGASGSGKSTLLNAIAGFTPVDSGAVLYGETDLTRSPVADRPISILFQDGNLFPHLSAFDNAALAVRRNLRLDAPQCQQVMEALDRVGIADLADHKPATLSGGQQSRAALARMLLLDRPIALLDEPFAALDPALRRDMAGLLLALAKERDLTLILVSHDLRDVEDLATHLAVLQDGRVALQGDIETLMAEPPETLGPWLK